MQLLWLVNLASLVCDVIQWLNGRVSALHSVVAGLISRVRDHGIHCRRDLTWPKQLSNGNVCCTQVFARFSGHGNSFYNIIHLAKKRKCTSFVFTPSKDSWGKNMNLLLPTSIRKITGLIGLMIVDNQSKRKTILNSIQSNRKPNHNISSKQSW